MKENEIIRGSMLWQLHCEEEENPARVIENTELTHFYRFQHLGRHQQVFERNCYFKRSSCILLFKMRSVKIYKASLAQVLIHM